MSQFILFSKSTFLQLEIYLKALLVNEVCIFFRRVSVYFKFLRDWHRNETKLFVSIAVKWNENSKAERNNWFNEMEYFLLLFSFNYFAFLLCIEMSTLANFLKLTVNLNSYFDTIPGLILRNFVTVNIIYICCFLIWPILKLQVYFSNQLHVHGTVVRCWSAVCLFRLCVHCV